MLKKKYPSLDEVWESILKDHNHSWYEDIYLRNKDRKEHIALFYRNSTYSYGEFFEMAEKYAKSLKKCLALIKAMSSLRVCNKRLTIQY